MKAQRIRKGLWFASLVLGAGVIGLGALYVLQKPAEASELKKKGQEKYDEYQKKSPVPVLEPPVKQSDLEAYIRRPEWKGAGGVTRYYPYAGPKVPAPEQAKPVEAPKDEGPKDLEAAGRVFLIIYVPPKKGETIAKDSVVFFEFNGEKPKRSPFSPGEGVQADEKAPVRFLLTNVVPEGTKYHVLYDVKDASDPSKLRHADLVWDSEPPRDSKLDSIMPLPKPPAPPDGVTAASGAKATGLAPTPAGPEVVAPTPAPSKAGDWAPQVTVKSANERIYEFTDETVKRFVGKKPDEVMNEVLKNVRTEVYDKGGVKGIAVFPAENDEMAQKFDVKRGDVLISVNGTPVHSKDDIIRLAKGMPQDTSRVTAVIERNGRQITYVVDPRDPKTRRAAAMGGLTTR